LQDKLCKFLILAKHFLNKLYIHTYVCMYIHTYIHRSHPFHNNDNARYGLLSPSRSTERAKEREGEGRGKFKFKFICILFSSCLLSVRFPVWPLLRESNYAHVFVCMCVCVALRLRMHPHSLSLSRSHSLARTVTLSHKERLAACSNVDCSAPNAMPNMVILRMH